MLLALAGRADARPAQQPLPVLDVPFISQSEALCGGAAAAMVLRYWGARGLTAESFAHLVDESAAGIRTDALLADVQRRGWRAVGIEGTEDLVAREIADGRPVIALVEDRPGTFHYVVVVSAPPGAIVFHDPARAPFRAMVRDEFRRRWDAADRWMAVIVPGDPAAAGAPPALSALPPPAAADPAATGTPCERLVADGVRLAQADDLDGAERALGAALACPGVAALRELAGVRLLQRRWPEVAELASAAVAGDPGDAHAWRLLATSRFVQNDPGAALDAWNRAGEPRLDLVVVEGLTRSRPRPVERLLGVDPGDLLTAEAFHRASRRLAELPSAAAARLEYAPVPGGLAELRAAVLEHRLVPSGWWSYAGLALGAAARREIELSLGAPTAGGERVDLSWRFWPNRPRAAATLAAPAPFGGVWGVGLAWERQPFDARFAPAERVSARVSVSNWMTSVMRAEVTGGADRWGGAGTYANAAAAVRLASRGGLAHVEAGLSTWFGSAAFSSASFAIELASSHARRGFTYLGRAGAGAATSSTPPDLWFGAGTGHARSVLLRAHPLLDDGALDVERIGRRIVHGSAEVQHWWRGPAGLAAGAAAFVDAARVGPRAAGGSVGDVDTGLGARVAIPGVSGTFRVDLARGLRDGAHAVSVSYSR